MHSTLTLSLMVLTGILLPIAGYAQYNISRYTARRSRALLARGVLALVGAAFGYVSAASYGIDYTTALLAFLAGFGAVHLPAAIILLLKRARGERPS